MPLKMYYNTQENTYVGVFSKEVANWRFAVLMKKSSAQVFSCKHLFLEYLHTDASKHSARKYAFYE